MKKRQINKIKYTIMVLIGLFLVSYLIATFMSDETFSAGNIAVIPITGTILVGDSSYLLDQTITSSSQVIEYIESAEQNPSIKAIVFEINSGGGSAVAAKEIVDAIKRTEKPTYALVREIAASAAYWIASATDNIIANELSIIGNIAATSSYLEFSGLLDHYNITYQRLVSGKFKDIGSPFRKLTDEEIEILQTFLNKTHTHLVNSIAENRNINKEIIDKISTGNIFIAQQAKELNLIDEFGDYYTLKNKIKQDLNITEVTLTRYIKTKSFMDILTKTLSQKTIKQDLRIQT